MGWEVGWVAHTCISLTLNPEAEKIWAHGQFRLHNDFEPRMDLIARPSLYYSQQKEKEIR